MRVYTVRSFSEFLSRTWRTASPNKTCMIIRLYLSTGQETVSHQQGLVSPLSQEHSLLLSFPSVLGGQFLPGLVLTEAWVDLGGRAAEAVAAGPEPLRMHAATPGKRATTAH